MAKRPKGGAFSLRAHLLAFGIAILVPVSVLAILLLVRSANLERAQLEARVLQVADTLADDVDRELSNLFTLLKTLASSPALQSDNLAAFYIQAAAAVEGWGAGVFLVDPGTLKQVLNTLVPWGTHLPETGDPATVLRVAETRQPQVSDHFIGRVSGRSTFNVDIPIIRAGKVRYVLLLGLNPEHLLTILQGQRLGPGWVTAIQDRKGALLARALAHERFLGTIHPRHTVEQDVADRALFKAVSLEGEQVLRAVARSKVSGWYASSNISLAVAEAPLRRSLWLWGGGLVLAAGLTIALAWLFERGMSRPMRFASKAAGALSRGGVVAPLSSRLLEANAIVDALANASVELAERAQTQERWEARQRLLLSELNHRVKNVLSVVQALAMRTLSDKRSIAEVREALSQRLLALSRGHDLLVASDWRGALLKDLVAAEVSAFGDRVRVGGPDVTINAKVAQSLVLVVHELVTNASKHGALSNDSGRVTLVWSITGEGEGRRLRLRWKETGGPPVSPPEQKGFGSTLLEQLIQGDLGEAPRLTFEADGFIYELDVLLAALEASESDGDRAGMRPATGGTWSAGTR